LSRHA